jgi:hypothetical protein
MLQSKVFSFLGDIKIALKYRNLNENCNEIDAVRMANMHLHST